MEFSTLHTNSKYFPTIRNDDVLQVTKITKHQGADIGGESLFNLFLEADKPFDKYQYPCTLAIVSEGIDYYPVWVDYIKKNIHRYKIELHGLNHRNYANATQKEFLSEMREAIQKIEDTFSTKITMWYPPFGRKGERKDCKKLGIEQFNQIGKVDAKFWFGNPQGYPHVNFHYWNKTQVDTVKELLQCIHP